MLGAVVLMIFALMLFFVESVIYPISDVATIFSTATAIIGVFAIWFQMKRERDIKEAEFILGYNTNFIENTELTEIERELEHYRKCVEAKGKQNQNIITEENYQAVINYLVYIEALAVFVKKGVLPLASIDDLFAYRFFLIMNNPEIQRKELCPEAEYYQGCFWLYKKWVEYRRKRKLFILLEDTSLENTDEYKKIFRL